MKILKNFKLINEIDSKYLLFMCWRTGIHYNFCSIYACYCTVLVSALWTTFILILPKLAQLDGQDRAVSYFTFIWYQLKELIVL